MLKDELSTSFDMKDLVLAKQILDMDIIHDRKAEKLWLSQENYVKWVFKRFDMQYDKSVNLLPMGIKVEIAIFMRVQWPIMGLVSLCSPIGH